MGKSKVVKEDGGQDRQRGRGHRYQWIKIKKILLPKSDEKLDEGIVKGIAESIVVIDLLHPIPVRRVTEKTKDGKTKEWIVLVAGAHRLWFRPLGLEWTLNIVLSLSQSVGWKCSPVLGGGGHGVMKTRPG
jgi:hypothetical protein